MIISDKYEFAFIHIPKCAGSSVRRANEYENDPFWDRKFLEHEVLGKLHCTHIPLNVINEYYPETFERIMRYESFAVIREPMERFRSAITQYCKTIAGVKSQDVTSAIVQNQAYGIIKYLTSNPNSLDWRYVHFLPQSTYINLDGVRVVKNIDIMGSFKRLNIFLSSKGLQRIDQAPAQNVNVQPANKLIKALFGKAHSMCASHLSHEMKARLKVPLLSMGLLSKDGASKILVSDDKITAFVREYYSDDYEVYLEASKLSCDVEGS